MILARRFVLAFLVLAAFAAGFGCAPGPQGSRERPLSRIEAIQLAVSLANAECQERYQYAPFSESSYTISQAGERWIWGGLDLVGEGGFSARVEFDARGGDRQVEVYYSTDALRPLD
ncbi:hypothetical protein FJ251_05675 [bacterium]|nr:hypothetical protein [bacterium]